MDPPFLLLCLVIMFRFILTVSTSDLFANVVVHPDGTTESQPPRRLSTDCGDYSSKVLYPSSKSFAVEINCSPEAVARCIAWLEYASAGPAVDQSALETNFWTYADKDVVKQTYVDGDGNEQEILSPIYVRDGVPEGRSCRRVIWFVELPTSINPEWKVICSYAEFESIDEIQNLNAADAANPSILPPINTPEVEGSPIVLPIAGAGFPPDDLPKFVHTSPHQLDVSVNVIKNEFIRCVAAKSLDFHAYSDIN